MKSNPLTRIKSAGSLYLLHLASGKATVYLATSRGAKPMESPEGFQDGHSLKALVVKSPQTPWVILVDQSEETFWGGVMPVMRGAARTAWVERMSAQSGSDSPFRWSEVQGKSRSQPDKLRVLGYTLGRSEALLPWLDALKAFNARIRGVYSPIMLTSQAMGLLKIKPPKGDDDICVLVTPHPEGLRQTVLVAGRVRFSRLALHPVLDDSRWFKTVHSETAKLREYLISSNLLKNDSIGMRLYSVLPQGARKAQTTMTSVAHPKDHYDWLESPLASLVYLAALAKNKSWSQLAPKAYCRLDLGKRFSRMIYVACGGILACTIAYAFLLGAELWQTQSDIDAAKKDTNTASKNYQEIAKTYPSSPLTAAQLLDMSSRWETIQAKTPPAIEDTLARVGNILTRHPALLIEELVWTGEVPPPTTPSPAAPAAPAAPPRPGLPAAQAPSPEVATLILHGSIQGMASDDLRGTRDTLARFMMDLNKDAHLRAEVIKQPLDLSTKATLSGSGTQEKSETSFEVKLWQR